MRDRRRLRYGSYARRVRRRRWCRRVERLAAWVLWTLAGSPYTVLTVMALTYVVAITCLPG